MKYVLSIPAITRKYNNKRLHNPVTFSYEGAAGHRTRRPSRSPPSIDVAAAAPRFLHPVKGGVRVLKDVALRVLPVREGHAHAEGGGGQVVRRLLQHDIGLVDLSLHLLPHGAVHIGHDDHELIAPQPEHQVGGAEAVLQHLRHPLQREVAQRICSGPGSKEYGILSVFIQTWYNTEYLFTVSENVFDPPPKVKSAVIRLTRNSRTSLNCNEQLFRRIVKCTFGMRRKMLRNSLRQVYERDVPLPDNPYLDRRPEQLSVEDFINLTAIVEGRVPYKGC